MSYDNNVNTTNTTGFNNNEERARFDPSSTFASGGLNNSTGREPFEDPRSDFATPDAPRQAVAGNLHVGHEHNHELHTGGDYATTGTGIGSGLTSGTGIGSGVGSGLTGSHEHHPSHGAGMTGSSLTGSHGYEHGDIRSGTSEDHHLRQGHQHEGLTGGILADRQTGDQPGGVQTGTGSYGTGRDVLHGNNDNRGVGEKLKDAVSGNKDDDYNRHTVGHGAHTGSGLTGGHPGAGVTGGSDSTTYGSNTAARDYDQNTTGLTGAGVTGTGEHGHSVGNKSSNDHKLSGLTRHGDDFTGGDTADSAYKNYDATGLSGREKTTTGVHDNNLEGTGAHKEGLMDKVKHLIGGHTNTTHADAK